MAFIKRNTATAAKSEGGNYITESGIYDVTLKHVLVDQNDSGSTSLSFVVERNGQEQVIWSGLRLTNNDGSENFQAATFHKLLAILDIEDVADPEEAVLPIGKDGADKEVYVLADIPEADVKMRVQMEYSKYQGDIKEKKLVKAFYREDGASAEEILNETEIGVKLAKDEEYASNVTYRDDLTAEEVQEWIKGGRGSGGAKGTGGKTDTNKPKFGKKFGK